MTLTLLAIHLVPKPVDSNFSQTILQLCLAGLREKRDLAALVSLRSSGVSKILKMDLLGLGKKLDTVDDLVQLQLSAYNIALDIIPSLIVSDISPILSFLAEFSDDEDWNVFSALGAALEKSTQGKNLKTLEREDVTPLSTILQNGLTNFEIDGPIDIEPNTSGLRRKSTLAFLRVCINLTNSSFEICESLDTDLTLSTELTKIVTADSRHYVNQEPYRDGQADHSDGDAEKKESRFELLILTLGLMINFVQESQAVKNAILASPQASQIKIVFEKLMASDVNLKPNLKTNGRTPLIMPLAISPCSWRILL
jgi:Wings apart-like protein regulation of heterochromatin